MDRLAYSPNPAILYVHPIHRVLLGDWRSWLARIVDIDEVTGSSPVSPTSAHAARRHRFRYHAIARAHRPSSLHIAGRP